jgi:cephalosporin hydroxylase
LNTTGSSSTDKIAASALPEQKLIRVSVDFETGIVSARTNEEEERHFALDTAEGFKVMTQAWIRAGWDAKYVYSFAWMGRPIIQLPDDAFRMQELIYKVKPDVIVETGVAHGGSLIFYASLLKAMSKGKVIGVDIEIRPHNRVAIEQHELASIITLIEGDSVGEVVVNKVLEQIKPTDTVLVILDSCHSKEHVLKELLAYSPMVSVDSFIVATDGVMELVPGAPRTSPDWHWNNPRQAALEFVNSNPNFEIEKPSFVFNEGLVNNWVTYFPDGLIRRVK